MSLRGRVHRLLSKFDRRLVLVEDSAELTAGAVRDMLVIGTELKAAAANQRATADRLEGIAKRLEVAVAEQGRTLGGVLETQRDEGKRRAGLGQEVMQLKYRVAELERGEPNGAG